MTGNKGEKWQSLPPKEENKVDEAGIKNEERMKDSAKKNTHVVKQKERKQRNAT